MNDLREPRPVWEPPQEADEAGLRQALPGLARIGLTAWWRTTEWTVTTSVRVGARVFRATVSGQAPAEILREGGTDLRLWLRRLLELVDEERPDPARPPSRNGGSADGHAWSGSLRERGAELLRQSADVHHDDDCHPAYDRILEQIAPDEARILRLMYREGAQAAVDIRTGGPIALVNSQLIAPGLTMIGREAGLRHDERVHAYLNNLERLGLIWFSREPLEEQSAYQVLEAQPEVIEAMETGGRTRTVRRSIHLTAFGEDFCRAALPLDTIEMDALPRMRPVDKPEPAPAGVEPVIDVEVEPEQPEVKGSPIGKAPRGRAPEAEGRVLPEEDPRRAPGEDLPPVPAIEREEVTEEEGRPPGLPGGGAKG
jgi:hypothetical protein